MEMRNKRSKRQPNHKGISSAHITHSFEYIDIFAYIGTMIIVASGQDK